MIRLLVSAGTGPVEVRRFVARLAVALAERLPVSSTASLEDPPASVVLTVEAPSVAGWVGTHALRQRSEARGKRARTRWYAAVSVLPEPPVRSTELDPRDVEVTATRSGGPGGQSVNTTDSAVIACHRPTGITVRVDAERSQHANRRLALQRLADALDGLDQAARAEAERERWLMHHRVVRGAPVAEWIVTGAGLLRRIDEG